MALVLYTGDTETTLQQSERRITSPATLAALAALFICAMLAVDVPVVRYLTSTRPRGFFRDLMNAVEVFGNGFGVVLILVLIATLDPLRRRALPWIAGCAFGAGLFSNVVKLLVSRDRPRVVELADARFWDTFTGFLPLTSAGSNGQSFPSAHTATAAGLAVALVYFYPRGRWLFAALTFGVGFQRIFVGAHFPSDVAIGCLLGYVFASKALAQSSRLGELVVPLKPLAEEAPTAPATIEFKPEERRAA